MYYLLRGNQLHVSALFIGHLQVDNEKLNKQLHSICVCCLKWGGKRLGWYEIWHELCRVGGVGSGTFCCRLICGNIL